MSFEVDIKGVRVSCSTIEELEALIASQPKRCDMRWVPGLFSQPPLDRPWRCALIEGHDGEHSPTRSKKPVTVELGSATPWDLATQTLGTVTPPKPGIHNPRIRINAGVLETSIDDGKTWVNTVGDITSSVSIIDKPLGKLAEEIVYAITKKFPPADHDAIWHALGCPTQAHVAERITTWIEQTEAILKSE